MDNYANNFAILKRTLAKSVPISMIAALLILAQTETPIYMSPARYIAASPVEDTQAPGGFGQSDRLPSKNGVNTPKDFITLKNNGGTVQITIANHDKKELWFRAADSNLIMWLEAQDGETWKPIQYHMWYTCGNSYHRVNLPIGQNFTFDAPFQTGFTKTEVRLAYYAEDNRETNAPLHSKSIPIAIDPRAFTLDPEVAKNQQVTTEWTTPTLIPKRDN